MVYKWKECLKQTVIDYCSNTALHGCKYVVQPDRPCIEKVIWFIIIMSMSCTSLYMFYLTFNDFQNKVTITALQNTKYHISNVEFPAVAICNVNKISRKRATDLSKILSAKLNRTEKDILKLVRNLGKLYDFEYGNTNELNDLQSVLDKYNSITGTNEIITDQLYKLSTPCTEILKKCYWIGQDINCSHLFMTRRTMGGHCCTFNYIKTWFGANESETDMTIFHGNNKDILFAGPGIDLGLTVLVHSDPNDYFYPLLSTEGFSVKLFNPHDYPDVNSGSLVETYVSLNEEAFVQISAITVRAQPTLQQIPLKKRGCVFETEGKTVFDNTFYSFSDCLSECKLKSILALCECVPFFLPVLTTYNFSRQLCTVSDLLCLNKHKEKWMNIYPPIKREELLSERENSISCSQCFPSCSFVAYDVDTEYSPLTHMQTDYLRNVNLDHHSLIHIYSDTDYTMLYKSDINYYWFDVLSNFGGICSLFVGFSLVSLVEIIYFFVIRYYFLLMASYSN